MSDENKTSEISFDEFLKVDIRCGLITSAERVPKSEKLIKMIVDFGSEIGTRQILAGIGKSYEPVSLVGVPAAFVINLPPRKMMGLESHGMILACNEIDSSEVSILDLPSVCKIGARVG